MPKANNMKRIESQINKKYIAATVLFNLLLYLFIKIDVNVHLKRLKLRNKSINEDSIRNVIIQER